MSYNLFLDDHRSPGDVIWRNTPYLMEWEVVRSYESFIRIIETKGMPDFISFDHDLSLEQYYGDYTKEKSGYDCAKWLVEYCMDNNVEFPDYSVHSMNPVGRLNIEGLINSYKEKVEGKV